MNQSARRVLFAFLDTGGGHRSAAVAVAEALRDLYGDQVHVDLVDVTADYFAWPLSELGAIYRQLVRLKGWPWAATYHLTNGPRRVAFLKRWWWLLTGTYILNLINNHPANTIVCCHPLLKAPIARALEMTSSETSLVTLVTDLASGHASWFVSAGQACLVATEQARRRALTCGLSAESVTVTGLPVRPCFVDAAQRDQVVARRLLGLDSGSRVLLIVGGADGTGPFRRLLRALADEGVQAQTVVITGRNKRLQAELKRHTWSLPLRVEGFVDNIEQWMCAADLLVTKAGPATICEALVVGVPMVLNGALPGQEPPNVDYVTDSGAGIWAPGPTQAARAARNLFSSDGQTLREMSERAQETARADAAWRVARIVWRSASGTLA